MLPISIEIHPVTQANWRQALQLRVRPDQQPFIADSVPIAAIALAKAYIRPMGWHWLPLAFVVNEQMVGFVLLAYTSDAPPVCWVFHFFIDDQVQGRGYGTQALHVLMDYVPQEVPTCYSLRLTVHPNNQVAQHLYQQAGFAPTEEQLFGEPVYEYVFNASL